MNSFDMIYNHLNSYYDEKKHSLCEIFKDFEEMYNTEYNNSQDDYDFQNWLDFVTPIYKEFYWDRINSLKKDGELYNAIELLRQLNKHQLCKFL